MCFAYVRLELSVTLNKKGLWLQALITRAGQLSYEGNGFDCLFPTINAPVRIQSQLEERAVLEFIMARYVYFNKIFSEYKSQGRLDVDDI